MRLREMLIYVVSIVVVVVVVGRWAGVEFKFKFGGMVEFYFYCLDM